MHFHIVTPSYNQAAWLRCCLASVRDQVEADPGIRVHHHVQDGGSPDETLVLLQAHEREVTAAHAAGREDHYTFSFAHEPDDGMYDAINRGWKLAGSDTDIVAHLNCDEQYLPGALARIEQAFRQRPDVEVLLADLIVVDRDGNYICHRRSLKPYPLLSRFCCAGFTASTFQRIGVTRDKQVFFDTSWRNFGDKVWYNALHRAGARFAVAHELVSIFTDTGANLNWTEEGLREKRRYELEYQFGSGLGTNVIAKWNAVRRLVLEMSCTAPTEYALYPPQGAARETRSITKASGLWHKRWPERGGTTDDTD